MVREEFTIRLFAVRRWPVVVENPRLVAFAVEAVRKEVVLIKPVSVE